MYMTGHGNVRRRLGTEAKICQAHTSHITHITSHISRLTYITHFTSHITQFTSQFSHHTTRISHYTSHITHITSHITHITSHITHLTSQITHHTFNIIHNTHGTLLDNKTHVWASVVSCRQARSCVVISLRWECSHPVVDPLVDSVTVV